MTEPIKRSRLTDIDCAKGLAIMLVVFGHLVMREQPLGNEWYTQVRTIVYSFHMPFFMYLGGFVMFYTGAAYTAADAFWGYIRKRAYRLLVPFFAMGLIIFLGKSGASLLIHVDNTPAKSLEGLLPLFWNTHASPAISLWYIFVVFIYSLIVPPVLWKTKGNPLPLLIAAAMLYVLPMPEYMYLDKTCQYFVFFMLGGAAVLYLEKYLAFIDRWKWHFLATFVASFALTFTSLPWPVCMAVIGTLSIPALHGAVRNEAVRTNRVLLFFGAYSFVIYLFNTILIGVAKGVMLKIMPWDGLNFLLFVPVLLGAGLIGPVLIKMLVFKRIPFLDRLTN